MYGVYVVCLARLGLAAFSSSTSRSQKVAFFWCPEVVRGYSCRHLVLEVHFLDRVQVNIHREHCGGGCELVYYLKTLAYATVKTGCAVESQNSSGRRGRGG